MSQNGSPGVVANDERAAGEASSAPPRMSRWRRVKRQCLRAFQAGLEASGLASIYVRLSSATGTTILMFHSVAGPEHVPWIDPRFHLDPGTFERRMRFLASRRRPVSLTRLVRTMGDGQDLPPQSVVVTFDDGYRDHLSVAAPILAKYGIPATFFLPTGYVSRAENQWVDRLHASFRHRTRHVLAPARPHTRRFDLNDADQAREAYHAMERILLAATYSEREVHLDQVEDQLRPEGAAPRLTMDWDEVKTLQRLSPHFEIGGHSRDHIDLSAATDEEARREIADCAEDLSRQLGPAPRHFSFPYERWTPEVKEEVRRRGFRSACGAGPEILITARSDRFALPRLDAHALRSAFAFATSGAYPGLSMKLTGRA